MHYCINSLLKNNNEIMQYCIIINDIALIMHYRALLQMPGTYIQKRVNLKFAFDLQMHCCFYCRLRVVK